MIPAVVFFVVRVCMPMDGGECTPWNLVERVASIESCEEHYETYVKKHPWPVDTLTKGGIVVLEHYCLEGASE